MDNFPLEELPDHEELDTEVKPGEIEQSPQTKYRILGFPDSVFIPVREESRNIFWNEETSPYTAAQIGESCQYQMGKFLRQNPNATEEEKNEYQRFFLQRFTED